MATLIQNLFSRLPLAEFDVPSLDYFMNTKSTIIQNEVIYKIPQWGMYLLATLALTMASGFSLLGVKWPASEPAGFKYFFYVVALLSVIATYRLISWKKFVFFKADHVGMYFPCPKLETCDSEYLFIPWVDIKDIKMGVFASGGQGNVKGVSMDIRMSLSDRDSYFPSLLLQRHAEWTAVGFTDIFLNKKKAISQLNQMEMKSKTLSGESSWA
jgi:hypothetical protein